MVLAKFWFAFLPERRAVAGGLGLYSVSGQPGNDVYLGLCASSLRAFLGVIQSPISSYLHITHITSQYVVLPVWFGFSSLGNTLFTPKKCVILSHKHGGPRIKYMYLCPSNVTDSSLSII